MKKSITFVVLIAVTLLGLSMISPALAQGPGMPGDGDHMGSGGMMDHSGFQDRSDHMEIDGTITVEDDITLTISVNPTDDMQDRMQDHHGDNHHMSSDFTNQLEVSLFSLVEYEDNTTNGYSSDDTIISEYVLDTTTLDQPVFFDTNNTYIIESSDTDIFRMYIVLNTDDNQMPFAFKWSVDINYPFASTNSSIAMLHNFSNNEMQHRYGELGEGETNRYYHQNHMSDMHNQVPMFFRWDNTAMVDGYQVNVTATSVDDNFALSIPQGDQISYDPEIGADPNALANAENMLSNLFGGFLDTIKSPTVIGLILGFIALTTIGIIVNTKSQ